MARSKKYFYLSLLMIIISFFLTLIILLLSHIFNSFMKIMVATTLVNIIILILSIILQINQLNILESTDWIKVASRLLPLIIFIVIIFHILSSLHTFGFIFK